MNSTQSETLKAKLISCVTMSMVMPSRASVSTTFSTSATSSGSSADVGSSNSMIDGRIASARAMATLLLSARELMRILVRVLQHAYLVQQRQRLAAQVHERAAPVVLRRQHHVLQHGLVREQVEALEHHADIQDARARRRAARRIQEGLAMQQHAPAVQRLQAVQGADQGRLARARRADDADDLARLDHQVDALEHLVVAETLARALDLQGLFRALRRRRLGELARNASRVR